MKNTNVIFIQTCRNWIIINTIQKHLFGEKFPNRSYIIKYFKFSIFINFHENFSTYDSCIYQLFSFTRDIYNSFKADLEVR